jgi:hypothetical protein
MAIVLQEVVGEEYNDLFFPTLSGVARSLNYYPIGDECPEDGITNIALGLGKYIVDGGLTLRFSPRHPRHILQLSSIDTALKETQRQFYALDLKNASTEFKTDDAFNLLKPRVKEIEKLPEIRYIASTFDPYDQTIRDGHYPGGRTIVSYANILQHDAFPLAKTIDRLLHIGRQEMGRHVEIEFAMHIQEKKAQFYILQIRPIVENKDIVEEDLTLIPKEDVVVYSPSTLGNGIINDVFHVLYVKSDRFDPAHTMQIAREIERINTDLVSQQKGYVLVGPGRWGSSDPWLGIPIKWPHISGARLIVESTLENYRVDPSQGTHFFQNLTSFGVGYLTINPSCGEGCFDEKYLNSLPAKAETNFIRLVESERPFVIKMDGRHSQGVVLK